MSRWRRRSRSTGRKAFRRRFSAGPTATPNGTVGATGPSITSASACQGPVQDVIRDHAERWRLGPLWQVEHCASGFAQLAQLTPSLDYPRKKLIGCFSLLRADPRHTGVGRRLRARADRGALSPRSRSLAEGHRADLFERIADAAELAGFELTIAHGGRMDAAAAARLSRRATVHEFVSYETIFAETDIAVMHGGMNRRPRRARARPSVGGGPRRLRARRDRRGGSATPAPGSCAARRRRGDGSPMQCGRCSRIHPSPPPPPAIGSEIRDAGGVAQAADIVEQVARTGQPCLNATAIRADPSLSGYALQPRRREAEPRSV